MISGLESAIIEKIMAKRSQNGLHDFRITMEAMASTIEEALALDGLFFDSSWLIFFNFILNFLSGLHAKVSMKIKIEGLQPEPVDETATDQSIIDPKNISDFDMSVSQMAPPPVATSTGKKITPPTPNGLLYFLD